MTSQTILSLVSGSVKRGTEGKAIVRLDPEDLKLLKRLKGFDDFVAKAYWPLMENVLKLMEKGVSDQNMTGVQLLTDVRPTKAAVATARRPEQEDHRWSVTRRFTGIDT